MKYTFFWGGPFSQWHKSRMIDPIHKIEFNCCEQYMMAKKALLFQDYRTCDRIMLERDPKKQKALGRTIVGFDEKEWVANREKIVYDGNRLKFTQNNTLLLALAATIGTTLVEASPYDKIWGIGLVRQDPRAENELQWQGLNLLGKCLTALRVDLCGE